METKVAFDVGDNLKEHEFLDRITMHFFDKRSLVNHQLRSFNCFIQSGIQRVFSETSILEVMPDYSPGASRIMGHLKHARVRFGDVSLTKPSWTDKNGKQSQLFPKEARICNMTYSAGIYVDMNLQIYVPGAGVVINDVKGKAVADASVHQVREERGVGDYVLNDQDFKKVFIGKLPIMVKSQLCHLQDLHTEEALRKGDCQFDSGGYFIIKGSEKALLALERPCKRIWCSSIKGESGLMASHSSPSQGISTFCPKVYAYLRFHQIRKPVKHVLPFLTVRFPGIDGETNVILVFRALGIVTDRELFEIICQDTLDTDMTELIIPSFAAADEELYSFLKKNGRTDSLPKLALSKETSLEYLGEHVKVRSGTQRESAENVLNRNLFPHATNHTCKALSLGYLIYCLLACFLGRRRKENRDDLRNKRFDLAGELFYCQLNHLMFRFRKFMQKRIQLHLSRGKYIDSIDEYIDASIITNGFKSAFSTQVWAQYPGISGLRNNGVVATLHRLNPMAAISHLRQTRQPVNYAGKLGDARYPNKSHVGRLCLVETPDGENCGLVKSLAITSHVSIESSEEPMLGLLKNLDTHNLENVLPSTLKQTSKVFLNGHWVGVHENPGFLVKRLRKLRRSSFVHEEVEIVEDTIQKEVRIFCDAGRILRPLLIVRKQKCHLTPLPMTESNGNGTIEHLLRTGIIEFVGAEEEERCKVASNIQELAEASNNNSGGQFSHCELHPSFIFGIGASFIPFANHNHASRLMLQSQKHCKQAIGHYTTCLSSRFDTSGHQLLYPQKPLLGTKSATFINRNELSNGQTAILAVSTFLGYNQEDSIVMNQSSIERGLFNSLHYYGFQIELNEQCQNLMKPCVSDAHAAKRASKYDKLDNDGLPFVGAFLSPEDIIFGKASTTQADRLFTDTSISLKTTEKGRVDQVILAFNDDESRIAKVRLREARAPVVGDKFSTLHGQKGVVGGIFPHEDMPFTLNGIVPDIIINPHAFPSRQTVGQLMEIGLSKAAAIGGKNCDATSFNGIKLESIVEELKRCGCYSWGKDVMINGQTGSQIEAKIFIGPSFYQRLNHMAQDKIKYRSIGPTHPLTRQPVSDRKRHGGVKIGEMERDCLLAHGASVNLQERLFFLSDPYYLYICHECHMVANKNAMGYFCNFCKTKKHIVQVPAPYSCKLLYQELLSVGICLRFFTKAC